MKKNRNKQGMKESIKPHNLTRQQAEKTKKYSVAEGSAYNVMYGFGEQYVVPFAIRLGASNAAIGILSAVPYFVGSLFQAAGAYLVDKLKNRKQLVSAASLLQALTWIPLFILPLVTRNIMLLTILFSLYLVFGNLLSPAWNSWIGDVVQEKERAKYFANRNRAVIVTLLFSVLIAGAILNYFSNVNIWVGFGILFGIAMTGRWVSFAYLQKQYEPEYIIDEKHSLSIREFARALRKTNFGNFTLFRSLFSVGVMIAAPFFAVYMLKNLHFSYIQYTAVILAPMLARILTLSYWGRYSEKFGNRNIMYVSIFIICFIPLAWLLSGYFFGSRNLIFPLLMIAEFISGFGWGGFELTSFNYSLEIVRPEKRAKSFAYFNVLWGVGVLIGGLLGSYLVKNLPPMILGLNIMFTLFAISTIVRFIVALIFVPKIKEVKIDKSMGEGELFFELVVAKPIDSAFHKTGSLLTFAQESLETIGLPAKKTVNIITEPFEPLINNVSYYLDGIAVKVETKNRRKTGKKKNPKALNKSTR